MSANNGRKSGINGPQVLLSHENFNHFNIFLRRYLRTCTIAVRWQQSETLHVRALSKEQIYGVEHRNI